MRAGGGTPRTRAATPRRLAAERGDRHRHQLLELVVSLVARVAVVHVPGAHVAFRIFSTSSSVRTPCSRACSRAVVPGKSDGTPVGHDAGRPHLVVEAERGTLIRGPLAGKADDVVHRVGDAVVRQVPQSAAHAALVAPAVSTWESVSELPRSAPPRGPSHILRGPGARPSRGSWHEDACSTRRAARSRPGSLRELRHPAVVEGEDGIPEEDLLHLAARLPGRQLAHQDDRPSAGAPASRWGTASGTWSTRRSCSGKDSPGARPRRIRAPDRAPRRRRWTCRRREAGRCPAPADGAGCGRGRACRAW